MSSEIKDFVDAVKTENEEPTKVYEAIVSGVDDEGIVWVNIAGSDKETPTASTSTEVKTGDIVNVEWRNNKLYIAGNYSNPSAGSQRVDIIENTANKAVQDAQRASVAALSAETSAEQAQASASTAQTAAQQAVTDAAAASSAAATADTKAVQAKTAADNAQASAENASEYAARALGNLSTVQSVSETLTWITQHGTMSLTSDQQLDPTHVYFVVDANGDYVVGSTHYSVVTEPDVDDIGTYYELTIDESLNNYVGTHLALDSEGLWLLPASTGTNKVLIATGNGSAYTTAGTYLIDVSGNAVASFRADGATMRASNGIQIAHLGYGIGDNGAGGTSYAPYYTFGIRNSNTHGNYSVAEGYLCIADAYSAHAEGAYCNARSKYTHAEGNWTNATGQAAHAEGKYSLASDNGSHAEGYGVDSSSHTNATRHGAHAEGCVYSGYSIEASGLGAHAEGDATTTNILASGNGSHAEGGGTTASGLRAHAEGSFTTASGLASHSSGRNTIASGDCSHAQNLFTKASSDNQTALGMFNVEDSADTYAVIIGNGTADNARSNALTVDWSGNVEATGDIEDGNGNVLADKADTSALAPVATSGEYSDLNNPPSIPTKTSDLTNDSGYIAGYTETDPVFSASAAAGISSSDISNWNGKADSTGFFKIVQLAVTTTSAVSAHGSYANATYTVPAGDRPSGMTLVGIVGSGASNPRLTPSTAFVNGTHSISVTLANTSASSVAAGATVNFRLLYIKATSA